MSVSRWRQLGAVLALPFTMTVIVPGVLLALSSSWSWPPQGVLRIALAILGAGLLVAGLFLWARTTILFAVAGKGTLAPWDPPKRFVVNGVYRYVRNPMISGVLAVLLGESLVLAAWPLLVWALLFWSINAVYIPLKEEPGLRRRFGQEYDLYCRNVPRWIPRLKLWEAPTRPADDGSPFV